MLSELRRQETPKGTESRVADGLRSFFSSSSSPSSVDVSPHPRAAVPQQSYPALTTSPIRSIILIMQTAQHLPNSTLYPRTAVALSLSTNKMSTQPVLTYPTILD